MTIAFSPTAQQFATLQYAWYGPFNQTTMGTQDTTTLAVQWYGPYNYAPPWTAVGPQYLAHTMLPFFR